MKRSKEIVWRSTWGNGPHKGRPAVMRIARVPVDCPYRLSHTSPVGALLDTLYWKRGKKTIPLYLTKQIIRAWEVSIAMGHGQWDYYNELYP